MEVAVLDSLVFGLRLRFFSKKRKVEIVVGDLRWSVVVLEWIFPTHVATFNIVDLLPFTLKAFFLSGHKNSTTFYSLLYALSYCHNISKLLGRTTHYMLVVGHLERVGKQSDHLFIQEWRM